MAAGQDQPIPWLTPNMPHLGFSPFLLLLRARFCLSSAYPFLLPSLLNLVGKGGLANHPGQVIPAL